MNGFDPGEGWREVQYGHEVEGHENIEWHSTGLAGGTARLWVREAPVPPLPTEPYTVIRVTYRDAVDRRAYVRNEAGGWSPVPDGMGLPQTFAAERITAFKVLAKPVPAIEHVFSAEELAEERDEVRRETAKAVLDRVRQFQERGLVDSDLDAIAREFGVSS